MASAVAGSISDDHGSFLYADVQNSARDWDAWLNRNGVSPGECIGLRVQTDATSALVLLSLLERRQSVLLWREPIAVDGDELCDDSLPPFCQAALIDTGEGTLVGPARFRLVRRRFAARRAVSDADSYVYLATSGSTGSPKIVAYKHDTLWENARNCIGRLQLTEKDRVVIPVALAHMYGLGAGFLPAILTGASVRLVPNANVLSYVRTETDFQPTVAFLTPNLCDQLVRTRKEARRYRLTVVAGDAVPEATFDAYERGYGCTVNLYGSTEMGVIAAGSPGDALADRRETVGRPLPGVGVLLPEGSRSASGGLDEPIPLSFGHAYGCAGYVEEDGRVAMPASLFTNGYYHTMDLGGSMPWADCTGWALRRQRQTRRFSGRFC